VLFFLALLVDGALAGVIYALVALAFVVVYKASRMMNFALGEWVMLGSRLVATGLHPLGFALGGALALGCAGTVALALAFNRWVLRRLVGRPLIALIMVTLGLGALMRGSAAIAFRGVPAGISLLGTHTTLEMAGLHVAGDKVLAGAVAIVCLAAVGWFFRATRTGLALRAIADDQRTAMAVGIDVDRHFAITWALAAALSTLAGTLWTMVTGGGFGLVLLGLRVFPIVIIGGLDSVTGTVVGALLIGLLESLTAGYLDPLVGGGFSTVASSLVLLAVLLVRPYGLFGRRDVQRV
jgi:branched-chain amino acid transport system permease protein